MFTGIIETVGRVSAVEPMGEGIRLTVAGPWREDLVLGESIAIDGVCLTVTAHGAGTFVVEAVRETLARTTLGSFEAGREVHLERALAVGDRLGGHFVQGHVDTVSRVVSMERRDENRYITISLPAAGRGLVAPQGSIAINGVSLTVLDVVTDGAALSIIPHTWDVTAFRSLMPDSEVNVEYDLVARYVQRLMGVQV